MQQVQEAGVLVIGGGPAGLFCALKCAGAGRKVVLLEKMPSSGRKLLITGSGQCNLTHEGDISGFFSRYGDHGAFLRPALLNFSNRDLVAFFRVGRCAHDHSPWREDLPVVHEGIRCPRGTARGMWAVRGGPALRGTGVPGNPRRRQI